MKFLVFQHIECEHPGIFRDLMTAAGITWDTVQLDHGDEIPTFDDYDALLVMGAPMDVWQRDLHPWIEPEINAIKQWVEAGRPYLGFCFGHQLLAEAMGGKVAPAATPEIGILPVELTDKGRAHWFFHGIGDELKTLQWHSAEVTELPDNAVILARSDACAVNAMSIGDCAVSVQFHVELTNTTVAEWGEVPEYAQALETALGAGALDEMNGQAAREMAGFNQASKQLFDNFLEKIGAR